MRLRENPQGECAALDRVVDPGQRFNNDAGEIGLASPCAPMTKHPPASGKAAPPQTITPANPRDPTPNPRQLRQKAAK